MTVTRRLFIASGSAVLAAAALDVASVFSRDAAVFVVGSVLDHETFDDLLRWASSKEASDITILPDMRVTAEIGGRIVHITDRPISTSEIEGAVGYVYGQNGVGEIASGFILDPSHEVRIPGVGLKRYRVNMTGRRTGGGSGIQISIRELPSRSFA